jgi:hypothetical protein
MNIAAATRPSHRNACAYGDAMSLTPHVLLDTSIAQLRTLAAFLAEEMGEYRHKSEAANLEARACKEILLTISVLIPKLQAARYVVVDESPAPMGRCVSCDEG